MRAGSRAYDDLDALSSKTGAGPIYLLVQRASRQGDARCGRGLRAALAGLLRRRSARTRRCTRAAQPVQPRDADRPRVREDARSKASRTPGVGLPPSKRRAPSRSTTASPSWRSSSTRTSATSNVQAGVHRATSCAACRRRCGRTPSATTQGRVLLGLDYADLRAGDAERGRARSDARAHVAREEQRGRRGQPEAAGRDGAAAQGVRVAVRLPPAMPTSRCAGAWPQNTRQAPALPRRSAGGRHRARAAASSTSCATPRRAHLASRWTRPARALGRGVTTPRRVRRERYAVDQEAFRPYFPPQQSLAVRDAGGRADARRALRARAGRSCGTPTCRPTRCATRAAASRWRRCMSTCTRARASTTTPRSGAFATARCALKPHAAGGAGRQRRPQGPDARRARDAAARVRPCAAQQPVGHALCVAGRHQRACATSSRRRRRCSRTGSTTSGC